MRQRSKKRQALMDSVEEWRDAFRLRISRCEMCLKPACPSNLDVHELVCAPDRAKALDKEYAVLALTRDCHNRMELLTIPHQLAYLYLARSSEFDLELYWELTSRRWPEWDSISGFVDLILARRHEADQHRRI